MKSLSTLLILLFLNVQSYSQTANPANQDTVELTKDLRLRFQFNQIFFKNWAKGGEDTYSWLINIDTNFARKKNLIKWDNIYRFRYGKSKSGDGITKITDNEIDLRSDLVIDKFSKINLFIGTSIKTQITTGYQYEKNNRVALSDFLDPVTLTQKIGLDLNYVKNMKLRVSFDFGQKVGNKFVKFFKIDDPSTYQIEKVKIIKAIGIFSQYKSKYLDKINFETVLEIQNNLSDYEDTIVNWRTVVDYKLVKNFSLGLDSIFRYDKSQSASAQIKSATGLTLIYNF